MAYRHTALNGQKTIDIPPNHAATIRSMEVIKMPLDMKGFLSLRFHLATKRLFYSGGIIDPGYHGHLFFTLVNLGDTAIILTHGQPLITAEFVRLQRKASEAFRGGQFIERVEDDVLPPLPMREWYDLVALSTRVEALESTLDQWRPQMGFAQRILDAVVMGGITGLVIGAILLLAPNLCMPANPVLLLVLFIVFLVIASVYMTKKGRPRTR